MLHKHVKVEGEGGDNPSKNNLWVEKFWKYITFYQKKNWDIAPPKTFDICDFLGAKTNFGALCAKKIST